MNENCIMNIFNVMIHILLKFISINSTCIITISYLKLIFSTKLLYFFASETLAPVIYDLVHVHCLDWSSSPFPARHVRFIVNSCWIGQELPRLFIVEEALSNKFFNLFICILKEKWLVEKKLRKQRISRINSNLPFPQLELEGELNQV